MNKDFEGIFHSAIRCGMAGMIDSKEDNQKIIWLTKYYMPYLSDEELNLIRDDFEYYKTKGDWFLIYLKCFEYIGLHKAISFIESPDYIKDLDFITFYAVKYSLKTDYMIDWTRNWVINNLKNLTNHEDLIDLIRTKSEFTCELDKKEWKNLEDLLLDRWEGKSAIH